MQTPLAIILGKLENLLDEGHLDARQAMEIQALHAAAGRLSRMNKALLLLARMEGDRFLEIVALDIGLEVKRILGEYAELMEMKSIGVRQSLSEPLPVSMNPELCAVLLANLIRNAMQHNVVGGNISIQGTPGQLIISNTGLPLTEPAERFFERFYKANQASDSLGLGLAVAKKICDLNGFVLEYSYQDSRHILTLRF
jgi:signal transduction histidine kinase